MIKTETFTGARPFKAEDMMSIVDDEIKEFDLSALKDRNGVKALAEDREANGQSLTAVVDDEIIGCGGIVPVCPGVGEVWTLFSYKLDKHPVKAYEVIRDGLKKLIEDNNLHRIEAWGRLDFPQAHTLFKHLGFLVEGKARKRTPNKVDCILYSIVRDDV